MDNHESTPEPSNEGHLPHKDFMALTHGHEWVNFYESFDKLVQDHLSRSSDLLRRAMSLPEVADREVAQVRAEMETKINDERARSRALLVDLRDEIASSHGQIAALAIAVQGVVDDLDGLHDRVADALTSLDSEAPAAVASPADAVAAEAAAPAESVDANAESEVHADPALPLAQAPEAEAPAPEAEPATDAGAAEPLAADAQSAEPLTAAGEPVSDEEFDLMAELEAMAAAADSSDDSGLAEIPEQYEGIELVEAAADGGHGPIDEFDLAALAALDGTAEVAAENGAHPDDEPAAASGDRPRPHWLSVTRVGSRS